MKYRFSIIFIVLIVLLVALTPGIFLDNHLGRLFKPFLQLPHPGTRRSLLHHFGKFMI